jgi:hypothetical protein
MAVTLAQAAVLSQNDLQRGVIETFVQASPVLDRIPLMSINGNAFAYNSEGTLPGVEFRAVNAAYTESTGVINQATESLIILGGDADVDTFIVKTRGNLNDQRAIQTAMKVKAASYRFQDAFFNGDVAGGGDAPNGFDGLKKRLTGNQVFAAGTNGHVPGDADQQAGADLQRHPAPGPGEQRGRDRDPAPDRDPGHGSGHGIQHLRREVGPERDRPWCHWSHQWRGRCPGSGRDRRQARLPDPDRVLHRSCPLRRPGSGPDDRRPELLRGSEHGTSTT